MTFKLSPRTIVNVNPMLHNLKLEVEDIDGNDIQLLGDLLAQKGNDLIFEVMCINELKDFKKKIDERLEELEGE